MSASTNYPQLKEETMSERVVAEWKDKNGTPCVLGSCLTMNKQKPAFFMRVLQNTKSQHFHIQFSLTVTIKPAGKRRGKEDKKILLVISPDHLHEDIFNELEYAYKPIKTSELGKSSALNPSNLHEAGVTDSKQIIRLHVNLLNKGSVLIPDMLETISEPIQPTTTTSSELIQGIKSLSNVLSFTLYMRPSDYAICGLKYLRELLCNRPRNLDVDVTETYIKQGAILMGWNLLDRTEQPPPYYKELAEPAQVFQSPAPPMAIRRETPQGTDKDRVEETPIGTPVRRSIVYPSPVSVLHGILSDNEMDLEDIERYPGAFDWDLENLQREMQETTWDSDEERYAREVSQIRQEISVSEVLRSEFKEWMKTAMTISRDMYKHRRLSSRLSALGEYARESKLKAFYVTRCWCSTLLFYDPKDSDSTSSLWDEENRWLVLDMASLIFWANELHHCAEMLSRDIRHDLIDLGSAARAVALQPGDVRNTAEYESQRATFVTSVLCEFGQANASVRGVNRDSNFSETQKRSSMHTEPVSGKRARR